MRATETSVRLLPTPLGPLLLQASGGSLTGVRLLSDGENECDIVLIEQDIDISALNLAAQQLAEYFQGNRKAFTLPLAPAGTPFQQAVWAALRAIPYGETRTYGEVAAAVGRPRAARAVGGACHANPLLIVTPCHRVVGSGGALTGFACGLPVKERLLSLERKEGVCHET
ncbi:MAG: methylated-DNA--[protein]-cysteine S-methyltransferase [Clostridiales bacterium]|nr:methylated-DNA--[protein]-cysteine S-methyltransferase [Clostridiales bacterium]